MTYITAVKLSGGNRHEHIADVRWLQATNSTSKTCSTAVMVGFIEKGNSVYVAGETGGVAVHVVTPQTGSKYLRTAANGQYTDNLLHLPRY